MQASRSPRPGGDEGSVAGPGAAVLLGAVGVFLVLALWRSRDPTLWNDEVMSVSFARRSWYGLLHGAASDRVHPPLFYALLKVWIRIGGEGPLWLRLLPVSTAALALPAAARLARELRLSRGASALGLLLVATSGYVVYYAQELRPYALLLLAATLSMLAFARALGPPGEKRGAWIWLALANTFLVYSHYFGWLVVGTQGLWILVRGRRGLVRFLLSGALPVLAFAPWAWLVAHELGRGRGLSGNLAALVVPGPWALPRFYAGLFGPYRPLSTRLQLAAAAALLLAPSVWLATRGSRRERADAPRLSAGFLAAFALVPPIVAVLVSVLVRPVFNPRYLVEAAVPTLLLAGAALASVPFRAARSVLAAAAATCCVWAAADQLAWPTRIAWGELVAAMRSPRCLGGDGSAPVYVLGRAAPRPVSYYLERVKSSQRVMPISSLDEIAPRSGSLAFHSGSDLAGRAYFAPMRREAVLAALEARGLRVLCEETSGPPGRQGVVVSFAPVGAAP